MDTMKTIEYTTPAIECIDINVEGVLCQSADTEMEYGGDAFSIED